MAGGLSGEGLLAADARVSQPTRSGEASRKGLLIAFRGDGVIHRTVLVVVNGINH